MFCLNTFLAERLSADTVCSKDSIRGFAPSVVASGRLGVELAFLELDTRAVERTPVDLLLEGVVSVF